MQCSDAITECKHHDSHATYTVALYHKIVPGLSNHHDFLVAKWQLFRLTQQSTFDMSNLALQKNIVHIWGLE